MTVGILIMNKIKHPLLRKIIDFERGVSPQKTVPAKRAIINNYDKFTSSAIRRVTEEILP
jgi:hypothetical protein